MALVGKVFGKAKRRGAEAARGQEAPKGGTSSLTEPDFALANDAAFWNWFSENADAANRLNRALQKGGDPEELVRPLFNALQRYDGGLSLLVGSTDSGESELVISAEGIVASFPVVTRLVAAAPAISGWRITAFKPRMQGSTQISINGQTVGAETVTYVAETDRERSRMNIALTLPWLGNIPDDTQAQIAFLLLDNLLGEFDVATAISHIDVDMLAKGETPRGRRLTELPRDVDALSAHRARH